MNLRSRCNSRDLCYALGLAVVLSASASDIDEDGIEDSTEQMLINRHRPLLKYDGNEDTWPSSVLWFVERSELIWTHDGNVVIPRSVLQADPLSLLTGHFLGVQSSMIDTPAGTSFRCNIFNEYRSGQGPIPVGTYAHVVPLTGPLDYSNRPPLPTGPDDLLVQYWQFFPYSDSQAPFDIGDHEGDWLYLDVIVERAPPHALRFIVYHHHGDGNCHPDILPIHAPLPHDGIPVCYLDEGSHEWWPWPCSTDDCHDCFGADPHDGTGPSYRTDNIQNLGERYAPMPGIEPQLILFFNGTWGWQAGTEAEPPRGPVLQFYPPCPLLVGHVDVGAPAWAQEGLGSRYHPFQTIGAAARTVDGTVRQFLGYGISGTLRIKGGNYAETYVFETPMRLESWDGRLVSIGQE